jgi:hypothetical protein
MENLPIKPDQIGALIFVVFGAIIGLQGWLGSREGKAMATKWKRLEGLVASAKVLVNKDSEAFDKDLVIEVDTPEGRIRPRILIANSEAELDALVAAYPVGTPVTLRINPRFGEAWVDGQAPYVGVGWHYTIALAMFALGIGAWFGWLQPLANLVAK